MTGPRSNRWVAVDTATDRDCVVDSPSYVDAKSKAVKQLGASTTTVRVLVVQESESPSDALGQLRRAIAQETAALRQAVVGPAPVAEPRPAAQQTSLGAGTGKGFGRS